MIVLYLIPIGVLFTNGYCYPLETSEPSSQILWFPRHHTLKTVVDIIQERRLKRDSTSVKEVGKPIEETNGNKTCCMGTVCYYPCPTSISAVPMYPLPPPQLPVILPARTVYEPVVHNHPPPHKIAELIRADKLRHRFSSSTSDETYSDTDSSELDTNADYYD